MQSTHQVVPYIKRTKTNMVTSSMSPSCHLLPCAETTAATAATATSRASLLSAARRQARRAAFEALAKCLGAPIPGSKGTWYPKHPLGGSSQLVSG